MNKYVSGNNLRLTAKFTPIEGGASPTVSFKLLLPDNTTVTVPGVESEDGLSFTCDYVFTMEGLWRVRVEFAGSLVQANELTILIYQSEFI